MLLGFRIRFGKLGYLQLIPHKAGKQGVIQFVAGEVKSANIRKELLSTEDPIVWYRHRMSYANRRMRKIKRRR